MYKENAVCTYSGILALKLEELPPYVTKWINLEDVMKSEITDGDRKGTRARFPLHAPSKIIRLIEAESGVIIARGRWGVVVSGRTFPLRGMNKL